MKQLSRTHFIVSLLSFPALGLAMTIAWMIYESKTMELEFSGGDPSVAYGVIPNHVLIPFGLGLAISILIAFTVVLRRRRGRELGQS